MPYPTVIHLIAEEFRKASIRTILVGGFAVNYHGVSRQTADIDFLLCEADAQTAGEILAHAGYREQHRQETFARWRSENILLMDVDFLQLDMRSEHYRSLCLRFGTEEIHGRILGLMGNSAP
jgi:hypothetical protein